MRSTFKILFYINRNKVKADGTTAVLCRITIDGKNTVITTGIYCQPDEFNSKKGEIKDDKCNNAIRNALTISGYSYREYQQNDGTHEYFHHPDLCQSNR